MKRFLYISLTLLIVALSSYILYSLLYDESLDPAPPEPNTNTSTELPYEPVIDPQNFTTEITNQFFTQPLGRELNYEGESFLEQRRLITNLFDTEESTLGVRTLDYIEEYYVDDKMVEEVRSKIAQDNERNVWIFAQEIINYPDNDSEKIIKWTAGEDGAQPGILIKGTQYVGDSYRMMYKKDQFEWIRDVTEMGVSLNILDEQYTDCVRMFDWDPLSESERFYRYYCSDVSNLVRVVDLEGEQVYELVDLTAL